VLNDVTGEKRGDAGTLKKERKKRLQMMGASRRFVKRGRYEEEPPAKNANQIKGEQDMKALLRIKKILLKGHSEREQDRPPSEERGGNDATGKSAGKKGDKSSKS